MSYRKSRGGGSEGEQEKEREREGEPEAHNKMCWVFFATIAAGCGIISVLLLETTFCLWNCVSRPLSQLMSRPPIGGAGGGKCPFTYNYASTHMHGTRTFPLLIRVCERLSLSHTLLAVSAAVRSVGRQINCNGRESAKALSQNT